ncbi:UDP-3-O-(3-hydroxymyristoyl)glucosamine N-acyltransferase [Methylococcus sp. EFPC2]|uniref:UDP-3-O-(3-hydroxymyristoyl)glucosamine N-acyltransferase n=1 Tax=Methylococcus sp. EFPC2 TaxID=2812648 RepID=UPI0019685165|nr:UDP-3-O-(3-hydroxymyristoyl)glucosamine N-acyltransferase [Methylococcus sp. EFPC2]QSA96629.1 UDP-3-O-(3-hydroxymyristoyl)glucosamine N-acyltransferase [Methylococcus sp. EFPC2]
MNAVKLSELSGHLAEHGFSNHIDGPDDPYLFGVNTLLESGEGELTFLANLKYRAKLFETRASSAIVGVNEPVPERLTVLRCQDPYGAVAHAIHFIHGVRKHPHWGRDRRAEIAASARIGQAANIGPFVTIDDNVVIGDNVTLYPGCYIGKGVTLGDEVTLYPNVVIYDGSRIGNRVTLHAGTVVGQDGLGYAPVDGRWVKIPQAGRVVIEDDVEMGANCAIDRATLGETRIGAGTKFSDAVVIGHGTKVGKHGMFVAQTGLAGSVTVGEHVTMGGQVGVAGHLTIGDHVTIGAKSGVWSDIPSNERYFGSPAFKWKQFWRQIAAVKELPDVLKKLHRLEEEVHDLRERLACDE